MCPPAGTICYLHPQNCAPFNSISRFVTALSPRATHGWTIKINPYAQGCDGTNCSLVPSSGAVFEYIFPRITIPFNSFTVTSLVPSQPVKILTTESSYNQNALSAPRCTAFVLMGTNVHMSNIEFEYSGTCSTAGAVGDAERSAVMLSGAYTKASEITNMTCTNCASLLTVTGNTPSTLNDATGLYAHDLSVSPALAWASQGLTAVCAGCTGTPKFEVSMLWWDGVGAPLNYSSLVGTLINATNYHWAEEPYRPIDRACPGCACDEINEAILIVISVVLALLVIVLIRYFYVKCRKSVAGSASRLASGSIRKAAVAMHPTAVTADTKTK